MLFDLFTTTANRGLAKALWSICLTIGIVSISACGQGNREDAATHPTSAAKNEVGTTLQPVTIAGKKYFQANFGDAIFRFPEEIVNGAFTSRTFGLMLRWPELKLATGQSDLKREIRLLVASRSNSTGSYGTGGLTLRLGAGEFEGPIVRKDLGLVQYKQKNNTAIYQSADPAYVGVNGERPFVMCDHTPSPAWDNTGECRVDQALTPQIGYYYLFSDTQLASWPKMDASIRDYLRSMLVASH